ncbi:MAG: (deoxy)nucleoside triphosphate pyrophosphohydrolase [Clostridiales bacterium]|nr:(deoxy)nucleoside triphosphate pyrophosphohydrolase [Clostridiales bacterium]MCF8022013.1 (deoxy)nucleoside triphosphate pyrophosphohydrolase [Clostridiales bacterium]
MIKVTAALLIKEDKILIARRNKRDKLAYKWEFPGGKIENGETPEECLKREMYEEFQIDISVGEYFGDSIYSYEHVTIKLLAYWARWDNGNLTPKVHDEFKWVSLNKLKYFDFAPADIPLIKKLSEYPI